MRSLLWLLAIQAVAPVGSDIKGRIVVKTGTHQGTLDVRAGGSGGEFSGIPIIDAKVPMFKTFGSVTWDDLTGLRFHYKKLIQGTRLITVSWALSGKPNAQKDTRQFTHYVESCWVEARPAESGKAPVDVLLTVEPGVCGDVEVTLAPELTAASVAFLPCDAQGRIPHWEDARTGPAYTEAIREGKALFKGMKPGKYAFFPLGDAAPTGAPAVLGFTEVKEKSVATLTLALEKK